MKRPMWRFDRLLYTTLAFLMAVMVLLSAGLGLARAVEFAPLGIEEKLKQLPIAEQTGVWGNGAIEQGDTVSHWCKSVLVSYGVAGNGALLACMQNAATNNGKTIDELGRLFPGDVLLLPRLKEDSDYLIANLAEPEAKLPKITAVATGKDPGADQLEQAALQQMQGDLEALKLTVNKQEAELLRKEEEIASLKKTLFTLANKASTESVTTSAKTANALVVPMYRQTGGELIADLAGMFGLSVEPALFARLLTVAGMVAFLFAGVSMLVLKLRRNQVTLDLSKGMSAQDETKAKSLVKERDKEQENRELHAKIDALRHELADADMQMNMLCQVHQAYMPGHICEYTVDGTVFRLRLVGCVQKRGSDEWERQYVLVDDPHSTPIGEFKLTPRLRKRLLRQRGTTHTLEAKKGNRPPVDWFNSSGQMPARKQAAS